ncbi:MAG: efflux RND transporter permease subunit, partial [Alistipes sp.]|nr:efflux RND transporter permease subunit [Alistipes sp.]
ADASSLDSYFLTAASGELVPMSEFVKVRDSVGPAYISQFNLLRSIELSINPKRGYSSGDVIERVEEIASKQLPDDISVAWSGVAYQQSNSSGSDIWVYLLALLFVFLCLAALYNSWSLPLSVLLGVPLAVAGALLAMWIAHHFSSSLVNDVYLQISIVILIGMAAKNSILVVEYAERLSTERGLSLVDATQGAARLRVRPILMTAFAFILGVVPLVFAHGLYSTARHILGVSLVGGMLAATLLGIYLYPTLYYAVMRLFGAKSGDKS